MIGCTGKVMVLPTIIQSNGHVKVEHLSDRCYNRMDRETCKELYYQNIGVMIRVSF